MTTQLLLGTESLLELAKKNAPYVYQRWVASTINKLNKTLMDLRSEYRHADGEQKKVIASKGQSIKKTIETLQKELL